MIEAISHSSVASRRFVGTIFNGSQYARTDYLGSDESDRDTPQALLVEQFPESNIPPHFHGIDQYQVVVQGRGILGKHALGPICVHFTKGYTGYGPVTAPFDETLFYFTLRAQSEPGAFFLPASRDQQRAGPKRNLTVDVQTQGAGNGSGLEFEAMIPLEDEGLGAWRLRVDPDASTKGPDPTTGGGQYFIVLDGAMVYQGASYEKWSCTFVSPPECALEVRAGPGGLEALVLQFPFWERGTAQNTPTF